MSETLRVRAGARATRHKMKTRLGLAQAETLLVQYRRWGDGCWNVLLAYPTATPEHAQGRRTKGFVTVGGVGLKDF